MFTNWDESLIYEMEIQVFTARLWQVGKDEGRRWGQRPLYFVLGPVGDFIDRFKR